MTALTLAKPSEVKVNRSELRSKQSAILERAKGTTVVVVTARGEEEKYVLDKEYFDEIRKALLSAGETLQIMADTKLFDQVMRVAETVDEDIRLGRLRSFEDAFEED